jgi:site-specific DNA-methyltransferase (adenine-specific)
MYERYLTPSDGTAVGDVWAFQPNTEGTVFGCGAGIDDDVRWLSPRDQERLGRPTQKPLGLIERIVGASSAPGDLGLDPFCGCGTAIVAAQKLDRRWIGIDVTYLAIATMRTRMRDHFPELGEVPIIGTPTDLYGARKLATETENGRYQFQWWAVDAIGATPRGDDRKKGADQGIDGVITFSDVGGQLRTVIVSVKSGGPRADDVRVLKAVMEQQKAAMGILVTLEDPTKPMVKEAVEAGFWHSILYDSDYARIQIITARQILEEGRKPDVPPLVAPQYRQAGQIRGESADQVGMFEVTPRESVP